MVIPICWLIFVFPIKELEYMTEKEIKQVIKRKKRSETATIIASISPFSRRYIQMVMNGDRDNEKILTAAILYEQEKSKLIKKVKQLVPLTKHQS